MMGSTNRDAPEEEEQYDSEEDEDFSPTAVEAQDDDVSASSGDDEAMSGAQSKIRKGTKRRKQGQVDLSEDLDSGDEATIRELKTKKKQKTQKDEDSGGEGGLIKTRAQRKAEKEEKAEFLEPDRGHVTVDVDSLWAKLSSVPIGRRQPEAPAPQTSPRAELNLTTAESGLGPVQPPAGDAHDDEMITIQRSYGFAGQTITEEKRVHKSSAEAKLWLSTHHPPKKTSATKPPPLDESIDDESQPQLRRPLRRASKFEPNPTGEVKGLPIERQRLRAPTRADVLAQQQRKQEEDKRRGKVLKLTTVQKSALDWAAHVDREGFKEELDVYGRSRQGFLGRMEFMRGVEGRKEEEERTARLATSAAAAAVAAGGHS